MIGYDLVLSRDGSRLYNLAGCDLYSSSDFGITWTSRAINDGATENYYCLASNVDGTRLLTAGLGGHVYLSSDAGVSWVQQAIPQSDVPLVALAASGDGTRLATVARNGDAFFSGDAGQTWRLQSDFRSLCAVAMSADGVRVVMLGGSGEVWSSSDKGEHWEKAILPEYLSHDKTQLLSSDDGTKLIAIAPGQSLSISSDMGRTWVANKEFSRANAPSSVAIADGSVIFVGTKSGGLYASSDGGATWKLRYLAATGRFEQLACGKDGRQILAINDRYLFTSHDGGHTWVVRPGAGCRQWNSVAYSGDGSRLAAVARSDFIYTSDDGGVTWVAQAAGGKKGWDAVILSTDGTALSAMGSGGVYTAR
jgi:photosystem II stability/assembly factor-like uncharacterized protein